ncbi:MAG: hypothetical protein ACRCVT_09885 [Leadbetterella sp.]
MATAKYELIQALRKTAKDILESSKYQWGHMGSCNCGFLAQNITQYTSADIHNFAMQGRGDWREQLDEYCPTSGLPMDLLIAEMLNFGFNAGDLQHLECLSEPTIKERIPFERREKLSNNVKEDVVLYLNTWANALEEELLNSISIKDIELSKLEIA